MIRTLVHASFTIERRYPSAPSRVFSAFADPALKARWFALPQEWVGAVHELDFRVGGREFNHGRDPSGRTHTFVSRFHAIVPDRRIVFAYDMHLDCEHVSVSLTTVELEPDGDGTLLTFNEQGAFFDGLEDPAGREHGTGALLDRLAGALER
jgi:uncharacterized protein YndB with AHSA1/START domain